MYFRLLKYVKNHRLFLPTDKLLVGVSGGADSMVLAHLINEIGNEFSIAHCNFNLRGIESDEEQQFVEKLAGNYGIEIFCNSFDTIAYAAEKGLSIEMAARDLRYSWFHTLCKQNNFQYIVVGHHADDVLETFMLNLSRGTGIRGLSGIKPKQGRVVRPLLFATRSEIESFAHIENIEFRHDSSNDDVQIKRNKVRHQIIPLFEALNPAFKNNLQHTIDYLFETEKIFNERIAQHKHQLLKNNQGIIKIEIDELRKLDSLSTILYELLKEYHFNAQVVNEIITAIENPSGQFFFSNSNRLVVDRKWLMITELQQDHSPQLFYIDENELAVAEPVELRLSIDDYDKSYKIIADKNVAMLDFDCLDFPLILRRWQKGEYFKPLGMSGFKKLSDFFIDQKVSIPEKENTWILASGKNVVWIIGYRIDDRFKITPQTEKVMRIELTQKLK